MERDSLYFPLAEKELEDYIKPEMNAAWESLRLKVYTFQLTNWNLITIFLHSIKSYQYRRSWNKSRTARTVFPFMADLFFMVFPYMVFCKGQHLLYIYCHYHFCIATAKLLQPLRSVAIFLLNYFSTGINELYITTKRKSIIPYLRALSNLTPT